MGIPSFQRHNQFRENLARAEKEVCKYFETLVSEWNAPQSDLVAHAPVFVANMFEVIAEYAQDLVDKSYNSK